MAKQKRKPSWLEVAISRAGFLDGTRALSWAYTWAVARQSLGHDPSAEEVAQWWATAERTTYREQAAFRKAFPELPNPAALYASEEAQAMLAQHAALGDKLEEWGEQRRANREASMIRLGLGTANLPST